MKKVKVVLASLFLLGFGYYVFLNIEEIQKYNYQIDFPLLLLSLIILLLGLTIVVYCWYLLTKLFGTDVSKTNTFVYRSTSEFGKYLPGRVLGYSYLYLSYKNKNVSSKNFLLATYYELLLSTLSAFVFFTITLLITEFKYLGRFSYIFVLICCASFLIIHPKFFNVIIKILSLAIKRFNSIDVEISFKKLITIYVVYILNWAVLGCGFFILSHSIVSIDLSDLLHFASIFSLSTCAGFMAFFMPAGLGAREGVMIFFLSLEIGETAAIIISVASRLWLIIGDVLLLLICYIFYSIKNLEKKRSGLENF